MKNMRSIRETSLLRDEKIQKAFLNLILEFEKRDEKIVRFTIQIQPRPWPEEMDTKLAGVSIRVEET